MTVNNDKVGFTGYPETRSFDAFRKHYLQTAHEEHSLEFHGTVKIHGANISIVYSNATTWRIHSRNRVLSREDDLYGCFATLSRVPLENLAEQISDTYGDSWSELVVVGEWAGKGIHKGVAICQVEKLFTLFNVRIDGKWQDFRKFRHVSLPTYRVFNICDFPTFAVTVNLRLLHEVLRAEKDIDALLREVEKKCPVASFFGVDGPGEGIVFTSYSHPPTNKLINFKVKGSALETVNRTRIDAIPVEMVEAIAVFVEYAVTDRRLDQGLEYLEEMQKPIDPKSTGVYIGWVVRDVFKEEIHMLEEMKLERKVKEVKQAVTSAVREGWKVRLQAAQRHDLDGEIENVTIELENTKI